MDIKRAYRFRFYPSKEQAKQLAQTFGCVRFVYNWALKMRSDAWKHHQESISYGQSSAALTALKKTPEHAWLKDVSSVPLQQTLRHLTIAFGNFFAKRGRYPRFKRKHGPQSAEYTPSAFKWDGQTLKLAKMRRPLDVRWSRQVPKGARVTTVTVSRDSAGRYFVSMLVDDVVSPLHRVKGQVGIDLGLTHFATLSTGEKVDPANVLRKHERKLARLQRQLARKKKGSRNRAKARTEVARLHARIADIRKDFLHQLSTRLVRENQVIAVESLSVSNMLRNHCLAKSIADASWSEFLRQLHYKCLWYGRTLVAIDRWFPSSKRCSECGYTHKKMLLSVRSWQCPECGVTHDRDINASRNVLAAGLAVSACEEPVRPTCASA
ncbi:MAG: IS200/IS605 family element RNA-guided endonuclease TnpB [Bradymonadia bacterium]